MGILGVSIPAEAQRAILYTGLGAAGAIFIPRGFSKLGQYMGRNVAQEVRAALIPGMAQPGLGPGDIGSDPYGRLTLVLERIDSRLAGLEAYQKKGG